MTKRARSASSCASSTLKRSLQQRLTTFAITFAVAGCAAATENKSETRKMMPVPPAPVSPSATTATARGEVKEIDRTAGQLTVKHNGLVDLHVPATTTVFRVNNRAMLARLREGDRVDFVVEKTNDGITIVEIELAK